MFFSFYYSNATTWDLLPTLMIFLNLDVRRLRFSHVFKENVLGLTK